MATFYIKTFTSEHKIAFIGPFADRVLAEIELTRARFDYSIQPGCSMISQGSHKLVVYGVLPRTKAAKIHSLCDQIESIDPAKWNVWPSFDALSRDMDIAREENNATK